MLYSYVKNHPTTMQRFAEAALAAAFITELTTYLSESELELSVRKNCAADRSQSACHLHDFCDANQLMLNAFAKVFPDIPQDEAEGPELDILLEPCAREMFDNAWRIASHMLEITYQE